MSQVQELRTSTSFGDTSHSTHSRWAQGTADLDLDLDLDQGCARDPALALGSLEVGRPPCVDSVWVRALGVGGVLAAHSHCTWSVKFFSAQSKCARSRSRLWDTGAWGSTLKGRPGCLSPMTRKPCEALNQSVTVAPDSRHLEAVVDSEGVEPGGWAQRSGAGQPGTWGVQTWVSGTLRPKPRTHTPSELGDLRSGAPKGSHRLRVSRVPSAFLLGPELLPAQLRAQTRCCPPGTSRAEDRKGH